MVVLEKITAPASRNRAAGGASTGDGTSLLVAVPSGTGTPLVAMLSLMVTGTPSSEPTGSPFCQRSVEHFATAHAPSGSKAYSGVTVSCGSGLCMGGHVQRGCGQTGFNDAREHAGTNRENLVVEHIAGIMHRHRAF